MRCPSLAEQSISPRHEGRLLAEVDLKPHPSRYWLHPPRITTSRPKSTVYTQAIERGQHGEITVSLDEMTGIQALERTMPDIAMKPGRCAQVEFEYIRHGTQSWMYKGKSLTA